MNPLRLAGSVLLVALVATSCGDTLRPPAAVVQGVEITGDQLSRSVPLFRFLASLRQAPCGETTKGESPQAACARFALGQLIEGRLVTSYARRHNVSVTARQILNAIIPLEQQLGGQAALRRRLAAQGLTFGDLRALARRLILVQKVARRVTSHIATPAELHRRYRQERTQFTVLDAAHILLHNHRAAVTIAARATPQNFAELARRYSQDPGSAERGGDLGPTPAPQLDPTFVGAALQLSPGEISGPVQTQFGWHVIRLLSVRTLPFSQVRSRLVSDLAGRIFVAWLRRQARNGGIDVNPRFGRFIPATGRVVPITCTAEAPAVCAP